MQTKEAALVEMVELNDEDLLLVSGGVTVSIAGPSSAAIAVGTGGVATSDKNTGISRASGGTLNSSFAAGNITITF
jgi:uncharacterized protein GlcG (DUF336 family)